MLTPWLLVVLVGGRGDAAEVSVFASVGVSAQGDDLGVVDQPVDHRGGDDVIAEDLAPAFWDWLMFVSVDRCCCLRERDLGRVCCSLGLTGVLLGVA